ncbi:putative arabinosyltransferase ARAD1, partial [Bienertia sinuspersici]
MSRPKSLASSSSSQFSPSSSFSSMLRLGRNSMVKQTLFSLFLLLALYLFFNTFFLSSSSSDVEYDSNNNKLAGVASIINGDFNSRRSNKVKIYMYDLPREFTYGVIESYAIARGGINAPVSDDSELRYPGNQHSAEWYLFSDLIKGGIDRVDGDVVRVFEPEEADLFYVPFFSSLSLVANPTRANSNGGNEVYSDEKMQVNLIGWLEEQVYWKRNNGWDHVFICQDPNALYKVIDKIKNGILLVSDFGRLGSDQASLVKDIILPYSHRINSFKGDIGVEDRKSLLFFMGNRYRKEGGKIRDLLFEILESENDVVIKHGAQSRESRRAATQGMHTSKFCLHPAGDTPSACRLFDALVSLCVPVIISDHIELPFEDAIDYRKIAVFVDSVSAVKPGFLVNFLRTITEDRILEYQKEMKK